MVKPSFCILNIRVRVISSPAGEGSVNSQTSSVCYPNTKSSTNYHNLTKHNDPKIDWDNEIQGHLLSAQSIGYILGNFVGGPLCGYFGGKKSDGSCTCNKWIVTICKSIFVPDESLEFVYLPICCRDMCEYNSIFGYLMI